MPRRSPPGLRRGMRLAGTVSILVVLATLATALAVALSSARISRELNDRLVPSARMSVILADDYATERAELRDYVFTRDPAALAGYRQVSGRLGLIARRLRATVGTDRSLRPLLESVLAAHESWASRLAAAMLAAAFEGDWRAAQAVAGGDLYRVTARSLNSKVLDLQGAVTSATDDSVNRLRILQNALLGSLAALAVLALALMVLGRLLVRRWLLDPFATLRSATDLVASGSHGAPVPAPGPPELASLGRSVEAMRVALVDAMAARAAAEHRFRDLLETSPDAIVQVDVVGTVELINARAEALFGWPREELIGQPVEVLVPERFRPAHPAYRSEFMHAPRPRSMGAGLDLYALHRDGHEFRAEISLGPLTTDAGTIVSVSVRDVSERVAAQAERERLVAEAERERAEARLAQAHRLESLGQLAGGVAHDFNNLLGVILNYATFVEEVVQEGATGETAPSRMEAARGDVEQIRRAAERATELTHQLLAFGRREVVRPRPLDLNEVVRGLEPLLTRTLGEHVELVVHLEDEPWSVLADPGQIEQVLVNLAVNARDAMPAGGRLTIDTTNTGVDDDYSAQRPGLETGPHVRLRVSDTGAGMPAEVVRHAFEPFFTTKPKGEGTGLGLATVYGIVTQAGGHVQIYSEPGVGTTISVLLAATDQVAVNEPTMVRHPQVQGGGELVLVVEDEDAMREVTRRILARHSYQVVTASCGPEAIEMVQQGLLPGLLITDVIMPHMLGKEVADRVSTIVPGIRVLYMSGYAHPVLASQGTLDPGVVLVEKPFTEAALLTRVRDALSR